MNDKKKIFIYLSIFISFAGMILTSLLVCKHNFPELCRGGGFGCTLSGVDGCSKLGESKYSNLMGWLSISGIGFFYYSYLSLLFIKLLRSKEDAEKKVFSLIAVLLSAGVAADLYFGIVNFTVLDVPCMLCAYTYGITATLFVLTAVLYKNNYQDVKPNQIFLSLPGALGRTVTELLISLTLVIALFIMYTVFSAPSGAREADKVQLLPEDEVKGMLAHLNSLKEGKLPDAGITSVEGSKNAYIVIHKFADFRCPHCLHAGEILQQALKRWPGRIKIYYRHFPLDGTCNPLVGRKQEGGYSCNGAQAAICASQESYFPEYYHGVFNFQTQGMNITLPNLKNLTVGMKGDWKKIVNCMGSPATAKQLMRDINDAQRLGLESTPTIFVQNRMLKPGTPDPDYLFQILDALVYENEGISAFKEFKERTR